MGCSRSFCPPVPPVVQHRQQADGAPPAGAASVCPACAWPTAYVAAQRRHQHKGDKAHCDEGPLADIGQHLPRVKSPVPPDPGHEMLEAVEKANSPHMAQPHQRRLPGQAAQGRDGQRDQQADQRPGAGRTGQELHRIGRQAIVQPQPDPAGERRPQKQRGLDAPDRKRRPLALGGGIATRFGRRGSGERARRSGPCAPQ